MTVLSVSTAVVGYAGATTSYLPVWLNGLSLWGHAVRHVPYLQVVQTLSADSLYDSVLHEQAIKVLEETLQSREPDEADRRRIEEKLVTWRLRGHA
ncbi:MAG: hypothetical protein KDA86_21535 [Planctomycetaceae bacterium]|nr:hypothetical protein [Planctomycetaceae bacterium]